MPLALVPTRADSQLFRSPTDQAGTGTRVNRSEGTLGEVLTCSVVAEGGWVERYVAGKLSESEKNAFESHYLTCSSCQEDVHLATIIRGSLGPMQPPDAGKP